MKEFDLINNIKFRYGLKAVGDDCAVLPNGSEKDLLMTADLLMEGIDFELNWTTPRFIGHKALAVSLSDIAAMGGRPKWAMLSLGIPKSIWSRTFIDEFYEGWHALAGTTEVELVGGDISRSPDKLIIDSIICGEVSRGKAIFRSGAKPGHFIYVSDPLGGAAAGLKMLAEGADYESEQIVLKRKAMQKQLQPLPQLGLATILQTADLASSMIDISDGLSSDLHHLLNASAVGAEIDINSVPVHSAVAEHFDQQTAREMLLNGGEDFELLFTCHPDSAGQVDELGCHKIGRIVAGPNIIRSTDGAVIEPRGFTHF